MKPLVLLLALLVCLSAGSWAAETTDSAKPSYIKTYDTAYNSLIIERRGTIVEMRSRVHNHENNESVVDLTDPLNLLGAYTQTFYSFMLVKPEPKNALIIGLGGAAFHRLFMAAFPETTLKTVELDPKVLELSQSEMGFRPTIKTPVEIMDGRMFIKRNKTKWDVIFLDAYRGSYVPPHLKTREFYEECAKRLTDDGILVSNLHATSELFYADIKTLQSVFPQLMLFHVRGFRVGNVIAIAAKYSSPRIDDIKLWADRTQLTRKLLGRVDMDTIASELVPLSWVPLNDSKILTDDFSPAEFLDTVKTDNTK